MQPDDAIPTPAPLMRPTGSAKPSLQRSQRWEGRRDLVSVKWDVGGGGGGGRDKPVEADRVSRCAAARPAGRTRQGQLRYLLVVRMEELGRASQSVRAQGGEI